MFSFLLPIILFSIVLIIFVLIMTLINLKAIKEKLTHHIHHNSHIRRFYLVLTRVRKNSEKFIFYVHLFTFEPT